MKAIVTVEFESFGDLTTALYETIREIKVHAKAQLPDKKVLDRSLAEPVPFELDGDNCYGSFEIIVTDEEAPPTPAPEVKEEQPLETILRFEYDGDSIDFNCPDEDSDIAVIVKNKGARHSMVYSLTLPEAEDVVSFLTRHVNNERHCNPHEPVKDTPVEADGFYCAKPSDIPCHSQCDSCKRVDPRNAPTEQPAHVSDTNVGDIREDIMDWIHQHPDANYVTMHGVYTGFGPDYWAGVMRMYRQQLPVIAKLTKERDTARQDLQKMIDDLGAKMEEAADYRQAINSITEDCTTYLDCINVVKPLKRKYPSTDTKPTI